MSTKRLSKTVIEGGRRGHNKWDRRLSHNEERVAVRVYCKQVALDPELAEEQPEETLRPVMKEFTDKLSPMYRWLDAQVGRLWSEVRSEVFTKFDTRTTAGRHITFDHLLRSVVDTESGFDKYGNLIDPSIPKEEGGKRNHWSFADYYVDQSGILCKGRPRARRWYRSALITEEDYRQAGIWLDNRMVLEKGGQLFWLCPTQDVWLASWLDPNTNGLRNALYNRKPLVYYVWRSGEYQTQTAHYDDYIHRHHPYWTTINTSGDHWEEVANPYSFRQRGELTSDEIKTFRSFKPGIRQDILSYGRGR